MAYGAQPQHSTIPPALKEWGGGGGGVEDGKGIATCMIPGNSYFKNNPILCALRVKQNVPRFEAWNSNE